MDYEILLTLLIYLVIAVGWMIFLCSFWMMLLGTEKKKQERGRRRHVGLLEDKWFVDEGNRWFIDEEE